MFWTLKNPSYPERIIKYPSSNFFSFKLKYLNFFKNKIKKKIGVTCCKFS